MSGLVLKLAPKERVLINGAVIENGDRRSRLNIVTPNANILRLKDAIHPEDANTPVRRAVFIAQLILSGETDHDTACAQLLKAIDQLSYALRDQESRAALGRAKTAVGEKQFYQCLKALRLLIPLEDKLLRNIDDSSAQTA